MSSDFPLTINRDGNLYNADARPRSARIVRRTPDGKESVLAADEAFKAAPSPWSPTGVAVFGGEVCVPGWQDAPPFASGSTQGLDTASSESRS